MFSGPRTGPLRKETCQGAQALPDARYWEKLPHPRESRHPMSAVSPAARLELNSEEMEILYAMIRLLKNSRSVFALSSVLRK